MATGGGPNNISKGLVAGYDTGYPASTGSTHETKYYKGQFLHENVIPDTTTLSRYNNPGFSGTNTNTGRLHPIHKTPIWKLTHIADSGKESRLSSGEGFGCYHSSVTQYDATSKYIASISFKADSSSPVITGSFNNGYSNIGGWNSHGTSKTMVPEGDGWYRLYTFFTNSTTSYSADGTTLLSGRYAGNTYTTIDLPSGISTVTHSVDTAQYLGGDANYRGTYQLTNTVQNDYDNVGASILDYGLDASYTKPVFNPVWNFPTSSASDINQTIYLRVNMPSAGSIRLRSYVYSATPYLTDSKYWKIYFDSAGVSTGKEMTTYWSAPMKSRIVTTDAANGNNKNYKFKKYGTGNRGHTDLLANLPDNAFSSSYNAITYRGAKTQFVSMDSNRLPYFDGTNDRIELNKVYPPEDSIQFSSDNNHITFIAWVRSDGPSNERRGIFSSYAHPEFDHGGINLYGTSTGAIQVQTIDTALESRQVSSSNFSIYDGDWKCVGFRLSTQAITVFYFDSNDDLVTSSLLEDGTRTVNSSGYNVMKDLTIGAEFEGSNTYWEGSIDGVRYFEKVEKTDKDLIAYYNSTKKRFI